MSIEAAPEITFRSFTPAEASNYAQFRRDYHPALYNRILDQHTSTGGKLDTLLDVGCGPGIAVRTLATRFQHAIGFDPSEGMIASAKELGGTSGSGEPIRFEVSAAEDLTGIPDASIDLLTAATAAHWFNMPAFWARAAQVLKPGGSVALWTYKSAKIADSVPNAAAIQAAVQAFQKEHLVKHMLPGNFLVQNLYADLPLPWTVDPPVVNFDKESFSRTEWGTGNEGALPGDQFFAVGEPEVDLDKLEALMATVSTVKRWREANPGKAGTEEDVVRLIRRRVEGLLHEVGVEKGKEVVKRAESEVLPLPLIVIIAVNLPIDLGSHTWWKHEVTFQDILTRSYKFLDGYAKIDGCCRQAAKDGLHYVWIDTCCIDKSSSAELSEGINSMFQWYKRSTVCYVYLVDVSNDDDPFAEFRQSRWFTRGWTLQELLAPMEVVFFDKAWKEIKVGRLIRAEHMLRGQPQGIVPSQEKYLNRLGLLTLLSDITNIPKKALDTGDFSRFCAAARLAWAANRTTTRIEDRAYSLLGLLEVNMPLLYGEGEKAFQRLQEEIIKSRNDDSLLAWGYRLGPREHPKIYTNSVLALSPSDFSHCGDFQNLESEETSPGVPLTTSHSAMTNIGLQTAIPIRPIDSKIGVFMAILRCVFTVDGHRCHLVVPLVNTKGGDKNHFSRAPGSLPFHIKRCKLFSLINDSKLLFCLSRVPFLWNCFIAKATTMPVYIRENPLTTPPRGSWRKPNKKEHEIMTLYIDEPISAGYELSSFYPPWISKKSGSGNYLVLRLDSWRSARFMLIFSKPREFSKGHHHFAIYISPGSQTIARVEYGSALEYLMERSTSLEIDMDRHGIKQKELRLVEMSPNREVRVVHHVSFVYMFGDIRIRCSTNVSDASLTPWLSLSVDKE
ncbi:hypothetical protein F5Y11DRAFT_350078 [Daldinia sp. FL1419]|nr:hypothetical protein F5Y11DRAFT_350078 [Daldinia sp. FL1419]